MYNLYAYIGRYITYYDKYMCVYTSISWTCMYVFTLLTLDMVLDLVDHVFNVYLSLCSQLTAEHVIYVQRKKFYQLANAFRCSQTVMICIYYNIGTQYS